MAAFAKNLIHDVIDAVHRLVVLHVQRALRKIQSFKNIGMDLLRQLHDGIFVKQRRILEFVQEVVDFWSGSRHNGSGFGRRWLRRRRFRNWLRQRRFYRHVIRRRVRILDAERVVADGDDVVVFQRRHLLNGFAVHERAAGASRVFYEKHAVGLHKAGVMAGNARSRKDDAAFGMPPYRHFKIAFRQIKDKSRLLHRCVNDESSHGINLFE